MTLPYSKLLAMLGGNQIFVGVNAPSGWGGCSVWVSDNGENYRRIGSITQQARMGKLKYGFAQNGNFCHVIINQGVLKSVDGNDFVVTVNEKVKVEGKKRPQLMDVDHAFKMDNVKYTKYLISFK